MGVSPCGVVFFRDSHAKGLESLRDIGIGGCDFAGAAILAIVGTALEMFEDLRRVAETDDLLCDREDALELVVVERPLGSPFSFTSLR